MPFSSDVPFSARYSLPATISQNIGEFSWETVVQLSADFQIKTNEKRAKVRKLIKELQLSRLILLERIRKGTQEGRIDPKLLVDVVKLIQRCEKVMEDYDIDLHEFSTFLFLISEKLKKEKIRRYEGHFPALPIKEEASLFSKKKPQISSKKASQQMSRKR